MDINQRPTPPNEWLFEQSFVPQEDGTMVEHRDNWCTQHLGIIPDGTPASEWHKYLYLECTTEEKLAWEAAHKEEELEVLPNDGVTDVDA